MCADFAHARRQAIELPVLSIQSINGAGLELLTQEPQELCALLFCRQSAQRIPHELQLMV
jgi:hypothetical protein